MRSARHRMRWNRRSGAVRGARLCDIGESVWNRFESAFLHLYVLAARAGGQGVEINSAKPVIHLGDVLHCLPALELSENPQRQQLERFKSSESAALEFELGRLLGNPRSCLAHQGC